MASSSTRNLYSRVARRLRHIADADEVRGLAKTRAVDQDEGDPARAPLLRYVQPIIAVAGVLALAVLAVWIVAH